MTELVSVIIPTHDRAPQVVEAVESVLAQRAAPYELIVIDDGSTDGSEQALAAYGDRLRYYRQDSRGVSSARNAGVARARGEWLAFLDSDDLWKPEKLMRQIAFHDAHGDVDISQTDEIWIRNGVRVNPCQYHQKPSGDVFLPSLRRCLVTPSAVMLRRTLFESIGGFDEGLPACEDYDFWLRISSRVGVGLIPVPLVVKRGGHADQLSRRYWGMDRFRVASLSKLLISGALEGEKRQAVREIMSEKCAILARGAERRGQLDEAGRYRALAAWGSNG